MLVYPGAWLTNFTTLLWQNLHVFVGQVPTTQNISGVKETYKNAFHDYRSVKLYRVAYLFCQMHYKE